MPPSILMPGWSSLQTGRCHKLSLCLPTQGSTAECGRDIKPQIRPKIPVSVLRALLHISAKFGAIRTLRCAAPTSAKRPLDDFREVVKPVPDGPHPVKPVRMHRKCEVIRNEGIEGVLPTTGRNPSSTAKLGLAANADVERSVGFGSK